ncbi:hypothetical protein F4815DRAFT_480952 [Daldinia loculata]|uniref:uncharacterized protein n=1 Tax=Daldinia loculata TaxID=103429 RepID=UPI0020C2EF6C|nr:uncharacterized protein F4817DRAFT_351325 [Daldinia loculata]KAI1642963.1 hypothetical protein F4817DRAFT_351325 [Daldinia loculata]KAI2777483.1 hypothetical protein F4815DRAFT_480952 [Daldinia loculata]
MPALAIPDAGLLLESSATSNEYLPLQAFGITLNDSVIEDMIKCVQGGQEVELTLGSNPSLIFGSGEQKVKTNPQSYNYDLYLTKPEESASKAQRLPNPTMCILSKPPASILANRSTNAKTKDTKRVTKPKPLPAGRSAMAGALSNSSTRSLPTSPALNGVSSPNPAFSASQQLLEKNKNQRSILVHELASRDRTYEYLAEIWKGAEADLKRTVEKIANFDSSTKKYNLRPVFWKELDVWNYDYRNEDDRRAAIDNAIRQYDKSRIPTSAVEWEKLLTPSERGKGIVLSKLQATLAKGNVTPTPRVGMKKTDDGNKSDVDNKAKGEAMARSNSQPLGSKTKKVSEREAQTKRLFSSNPKKPAPKKPASKPKPAEEKGRKFLSDEKVIDSESSGDERPLSRASSNQSSLKPIERPIKKPTEKPVEKSIEKPIEKPAERPVERRIEKPVEKPVERVVEKPKEKPAPPKAKPVVRAPRAPVKPSGLTSQKRPREDDDSSSSSGAPLSKRIKPREPPKPLSNVTNLKHRPSDASQSSRNAPVGVTSSSISMRSKNTSPTKSSPLASSPPTNASDLEDHQPPPRQLKPPVRNGERTTNGAVNGSSTAMNQTKKRKERDADQYSSQQSAPNKKPRVPPDVLIKAKKFTRFYERYEALHYEIAALKEPPEDKLADLIDMRERLSVMKTEISQAVASY